MAFRPASAFAGTAVPLRFHITSHTRLCRHSWLISPNSHKNKENTKMSAQPEVWRVSTVEGIFETDLETLKQWIAEGCVLPTDKVSKGSLNWIDAGRAPMLKAAFAGDYTPQPAAAAAHTPPPPAEAASEPENQWQAVRPVDAPATGNEWTRPDYGSQEDH